VKRLLLLVVLSGAAFAADHPCVILAPPRRAMLPFGGHHSLVYVAGDFPSGIPFRTQMKDSIVDQVKAKGGQVIVLAPEYTREDFEAAKAQCVPPLKPTPTLPPEPK
jgi:hypothetical protein